MEIYKDIKLSLKLLKRLIVTNIQIQTNHINDLELQFILDRLQKMNLRKIEGKANDQMHTGHLACMGRPHCHTPVSTRTYTCSFTSQSQVWFTKRLSINMKRQVGTPLRILFTVYHMISRNYTLQTCNMSHIDKHI